MPVQDIKISSPTRVDLAGGTLDLWPLYSFVGKSYTINLSIDVYTHVAIKIRQDREVLVKIKDLNYSKKYIDINEVLSSRDQELVLLGSVFEYFKPNFGFEIETSSESPVGGGLGGSSSLFISLLKTFSYLMDHKYSVNEMVTLASNLEAGVLNTPTGTQDYFPAAKNGLSAIAYSPLGVEQELLKFPKDLFQDRIFLVDTGRSHHSGINNWQVYKAMVEKDTTVKESLKGIQSISQAMYTDFKKNDYSKMTQYFQSEYQYRTRLAECFSSPEIEKIQSLMQKNGALAVKILGAGGGGCVLVWCEKNKIQDHMLKAQESGFKTIKINPVLDKEFYES